MNIFYLDSDPKTCATYHCDKHVVKMILEYTQLLCTAHRSFSTIESISNIPLYKATHKNHPSAIWVRESPDNYNHLTTLLKHLCAEYTHRYNKTHLCERSGLVDGLVTNNPVKPSSATYNGFNGIPMNRQAMPDEYKNVSGVEAYRAYYIGTKKHIAVWTNRSVPNWFKEVT